MKNKVDIWPALPYRAAPKDRLDGTVPLAVSLETLQENKMNPLHTYRLKPNPRGKDRPPHGGPSAAQLGAEWVDLRNSDTSPKNLQGVKLYHLAFRNGRPSHWDLIMPLKGVLHPKKVLRIHAGPGPESILNPEDKSGADHHLFTGRNQYVWNNAEGDTSRLTEWLNGQEQETDRASYDPNPPEGAVLVRSGDKLVPSTVAAGGSALRGY